jgi:prepilin-type processing-associated H-X9-DG protein/prepilin-type N-terminal cleavage/methylation domain-containing protein
MTSARSGFSLVELLVVIGIIAMLISILLPALSKAQQAAKAVACASNMRQIGMSLQMYGDLYRGWIFPVGKWLEDALPPETPRPEYKSLGANVPPHERWPMHVFKFTTPPLIPTPTYSLPAGPWDLLPEDEVKPWTPALMLCPADMEPRSAHSYIINKLLVKDQEKIVKFGGRTDKHGPTTLIVAGEKTTTTADYYMELTIYGGAVDAEGKTEFERVVEQERHGRKRGSNYLFFDGHVEMQASKEADKAFDPWNTN